MSLWFQSKCRFNNHSNRIAQSPFSTESFNNCSLLNHSTSTLLVFNPHSVYYHCQFLLPRNNFHWLHLSVYSIILLLFMRKKRMRFLKSLILVHFFVPASVSWVQSFDFHFGMVVFLSFCLSAGSDLWKSHRNIHWPHPRTQWTLFYNNWNTKLKYNVKALSRGHRSRCCCGFTVGRNRRIWTKPTCSTQWPQTSSHFDAVATLGGQSVNHRVSRTMFHKDIAEGLRQFINHLSASV